MRTFWATCIVAVLGACGCVQHTRPIVPPTKLTEAERNFQAVWEASKDVLRGYQFTINRQDRRAGVIITEQIVGKHFFEFWRRDAVGPRETAESAIQPTYLMVTVRIRSTGPSTYEPAVAVAAARPRSVGDNVTSTGEAYNALVLPRDRTRSDLEAADAVDLPGKPGKEVPGGRGLARRIAEEIRAEAARKLAGRSSFGRKILGFLGG